MPGQGSPDQKLRSEVQSQRQGQKPRAEFQARTESQATQKPRPNVEAKVQEALTDPGQKAKTGHTIIQGYSGKKGSPKGQKRRPGQMVRPCLARSSGQKARPDLSRPQVRPECMPEVQARRPGQAEVQARSPVQASPGEEARQQQNVVQRAIPEQKARTEGYPRLSGQAKPVVLARRPERSIGQLRRQYQATSSGQKAKPEGKVWLSMPGDQEMAKSRPEGQARPGQDGRPGQKTSPREKSRTDRCPGQARFLARRQGQEGIKARRPGQASSYVQARRKTGKKSSTEN